MLEAQLEREDKYEVDDDFAVPDFVKTLPAGGRVEQATANLDSVYYDTDDQDLFGQGVTLRRRSGGTDAGWHLKVPADKARTELRLPVDDADGIPAELTNLVAGVALGKPLRPVATISTVRGTYRLVDEHGILLAEVADDRVQATAVADSARTGRWREVEVELGEGGDEKLLKRIGKSLTRGTARPSVWGSKLGRALSTDPAPAVIRADDTGRTVLLAYLDAQVEAIVAGDVWLRRGLDPIHSTRVGIRRFRSTLRVFQDLFDPGRQAALDDELKWYAGILGEVRDRQVQRERFAGAVAELPVELLMGPVAARIENDLLAEQLRCHDAVMATLVSARYRELVASLARWRIAPPFADEGPVGEKAITGAARKARRKAKKRLATAVATADDARLHRARKAAKRARYAAELGAPVIGRKNAKKKVKKYKKIQRVLGEHQDSVVATGTLRMLGARAGSTPGENGFAFGLLYALEQQNAENARADAARLVT
ncbi:CHAD domain-containing protein [Rhodococcus sp. NPDC003318]|uniref:CYTH and CHAD domain-containing protein n=1 Tax=Rhodococcus sp. NPDC003318 TaxID=3364503 RepID=UPI0036890B53